MKIVLSFFLLFCVTFVSAQTRMRDYIVQMPDSVMPLMTTVNRADCVDFCEAGMEAKVTNRLGGTTILSALTDDYALWHYTASSQVEMKRLPLTDSTSVICLVHTVLLPEPDSHIDFYDEHWQPLPTEHYASTLPGTNRSSSSLSTLHISLSPDAPTLKAELHWETYTMKDEHAVLTPATETYWYDWKEGTFTLR